MVQGKINRGRHTDHLAGCHSIWTNQCPPPPSTITSNPTQMRLSLWEMFLACFPLATWHMTSVRSHTHRQVVTVPSACHHTSTNKQRMVGLSCWGKNDINYDYQKQLLPIPTLFSWTFSWLIWVRQVPFFFLFWTRTFQDKRQRLLHRQDASPHPTKSLKAWKETQELTTSNLALSFYLHPSWGSEGHGSLGSMTLVHRRGLQLLKCSTFCQRTLHQDYQ